MQKNEVQRAMRSIAKGAFVVPRMGVWAGEQCLVLDVEKRLHAAGSYKVVHVLLPNGDDRWYPITQVTEVARDKAAILKKPRLRANNSPSSNEKLHMLVVIQPLAGTARANLVRAKVEIARALNFRGSVTSAEEKGDRVIVKFAVNPAWNLPLSEKVELLKQWIPAKTRLSFKVHEVYLEGKANGKG